MTSDDRRQKVTVEGIARLPGWVHAVVANGFVFVAGTLGTSGVDFGSVVPGGAGAETTQALRNIERVLSACGTSLQDVVQVTIYLTDMRDFAVVEPAYREVMGDDGPPRTTVEVSRLGVPASIEIQCIAQL